MQVIKKDGTLEDYNEQKIIDACNKAAKRAMIELSEDDYAKIVNDVWVKIEEIMMKTPISKSMICIISWKLF